MMDDIDTALAKLARDPVPARLLANEISVLQRISGHSFAAHGDVTTRLRIVVVGAALIMGVAGGLLPAKPVPAQHSLSPIGGAAELAPSALLTDGW